MNRGRYLCGLVLLGVAASAPAASLVGATVTYNYDPNALGLFGTPITVVGDTLVFAPTDFGVEALNDVGLQRTSETINITVTPNDGSSPIGVVSLLERGDYQRSSAQTSVSVSGQLRATDLVNNPNENQFTDGIESPTNFVVTGLTTPPLDWDAHASVDTSGWSTNELLVTIQNFLYATSLVPGDGAFLQKKYVGLTATTVVPIPGAVWLFASAFVGVFGPAIRRRLAAG